MADVRTETAPWIEKLARFGYGAKGVVYLLVGGLAAVAAFTGGGQTTDSSGALAAVADDPGGRALLAVIAVGLFGYVLWRILGVVRNPEHESGGKRVFFAVTGLAYGTLAVEAARLALYGVGGASGQNGNGAAHWSGEVMAQPLGQLLLAAAGVAIGAYGIHQIVSGWRVDLDDQLALGAMSANARRWTVRISRFGLAARGLVFTIIGGFLVVAAIQSDPSEATGIGGVLTMMRGTPWLLGVLALGLVAYGVYNLVRARYRVIRPA